MEIDVVQCYRRRRAGTPAGGLGSRGGARGAITIPIEGRNGTPNKLPDDDEVEVSTR